MSAVNEPNLIKRQNISFGLSVHDINIVVGKINRLNPVTRRINDCRDASTIPATRDQRRHQAYG